MDKLQCLHGEMNHTALNFELLQNKRARLTEKLNKMQQCIKILLFFILNKAQHVSGDTPPIIRSLKLHKQPLVLHNTVVVRRQVAYAT
jgi:hypothetical protein